MNPKGNILIYILLGVLILALIGGGSYMMGMKNVQPQVPIVPPVIVTPSVTPATNLQTYTNSQYGFSFSYPASFVVIDKSSQFSPFTIFIEDSSRQVNSEGGMSVNPYMMISAKPSQSTAVSYVNNAANNLTLLNSQTFGSNNYVVAQETHGMAAADFNQYLIQHNGYIFNISNSVSPIDSSTLNQILSTFTFIDQNPASTGPQTCTQSSDCPSGDSCMVAGPIAAEQPVKKICVKPGQMVPL